MAAARHVLSVRQNERQLTVLKPTLSDSARDGSFVPAYGVAFVLNLAGRMSAVGTGLATIGAIRAIIEVSHARDGGLRSGCFKAALRAKRTSSIWPPALEMMMVSPDPLERLNAQMSDVDDVYIGARWDAETYVEGLERGLREAVCRPFPVSAKVGEPGFPDAMFGDQISGQCVAHSEGYWLVYQPESDRFLCFWGTDINNLVAPGIYGSPLGCWSA